MTRTFRRGAASAAATAFVLYAFAACSSDPGGGGSTPGPATPDGSSTPDESGSDGATGGGDGASEGGAADVIDGGAIDAPADAPPAVPALRFVGRRDETDPLGPSFSWPGSRIIARWNGTEVKVTLNETPLFNPPPNPTYWDVLVDGVVTAASPIALTPGVATYTLASGLPAGVHTVELYKRTEGRVGITQLRGFEFPGGGALLPPPVAPTRRIEILSDSTTTGYGIECNAADETFTSLTQNERRGWAGLVASELGADHHNVSIAGKGVLLNLNRAEGTLYDEIFLRTVHNGAADWTFTKFVPDVVFVMLGSNDYDTGNPASQPVFEDFKNKYIALVNLVRSKYAAAHVFLATAPNLNDDYPVGYDARTNVKAATTAAVNARAALGDTKVYTFEFTRSNYPGDQTGCGFHVNLAKSRAMADEAKIAIKARTGW